MQIGEAADLARELMNFHNLGHWSFGLDRAKRRAGCCKYRKKLITLSSHYVELNDLAQITDTIKHEIAHALVGPGYKHGPVWKQVALSIGAIPRACYGSQVVMPKGRWRATCPGCGREFCQHRRPKSSGFRYCLACGEFKGRLVYYEFQGV